MLLKPERPIPASVTQLTGIADADVAEAKTFKQVAADLERTFKGCDFAGYNSNSFDIPMLAEEFLRAGIDFDFNKCRLIDAYVIGSRAAQKCMLRALLEPKETISKLELAGEGYKVLALIEEQKAMPWQAVYDEFCVRNNVPVGQEFIADIDQYVADVTSKR